MIYFYIYNYQQVLFFYKIHNFYILYILFLPFDSGIKEFENLLIEFDGQPHFEIISHFGGIKSYKKRIKHDIMKNKYCLENNKLLLRISYLDIDDIDFWVEY